MNKHLVLLSMFSAALAACSSTTTVSGPGRLDTVSGLNGAKVEISAEGGFAAFSIRHVVSHDDRGYLFVRRHLCGQTCGAPLDSVSGTLSQAATDSLFTLVLAQDPFSLKDDYGPTQGGADMFAYTVRITADGRTKSVRFDDGTMPEPMRQILVAVQASVSAARR